jgi:predicted transcriptional regulator
MLLPDVKDIVSLRKKMGLSQRKLANKCGLGFAWINQVESEKIKDPSYSKLKKIADFYELRKENKGWTAGEICNTNILTAEMGESLQKANEKMISKGISQIPVMSKNKLIGMLTDKKVRDFFYADKSNIMINQKMLEPPPPIFDSSTPANILHQILEYFDCVLIEKDGKIHGIVVNQDLSKLTGSKNKKIRK